MIFFSTRCLTAAIMLLLTLHTSKVNAIDNAYSPDLGIDNTSDFAVAVWVKDNAFPSIVQASTSVAGTWATPVTISDPTYVSLDPVLAVNDLGDVVVVWAYFDTVINRMALASSVLPSGGSWSTPVRLSGVTEEVIVRGNTNGKFPYSVKLSNSGDLSAVWSSFIGPNREVLATTGTSLTWILTPTLLSP